MNSKQIYVVRHAKSSWRDLTVEDKKRKLNSRGKKAAPIMAEWCLNNGIIPQNIISSTAVRAYKTAEHFRKILGVTEDHYKLYENLYHAPAYTYIETCFELPETVETVMLFGHNPGITYLANEVSSEYINNVPTCGILIIKSSASTWQELAFDNCKLINYMFPKMLSDEL